MENSNPKFVLFLSPRQAWLLYWGLALLPFSPFREIRQGLGQAMAAQLERDDCE